MKKIRDASTIIGMLENGQLNPAFSAEIGHTLEELSTLKIFLYVKGAAA